MKLINLKQYEVENPHGILFLKDEDGKDWYENQKEFSPDTVKIVVAGNGRITSVSKDVSTLFPINASVYEVDSLPDGFKLEENWHFVDEKVIYIDPLTTEKGARKWRNKELENTDKYMTLDAPITPEQQAELKEYRKALRDWPAQKKFPKKARPTPPSWL